MIDHGIAGLMSAHVVYEHVDKVPASFSHYWLTSVLREQLNYQGVIFSDDLSMQGAHVIGGIRDRIRAAIDAGSDMVLVCNRPEDIPEAIEEFDNYNNPISQLRLARFHGKKPGQMESHQQHQLNEFIQNYQLNRSLELNLD